MLLVTFYFAVGTYRASTRQIDLTPAIAVLLVVAITLLIGLTTFKVSP